MPVTTNPPSASGSLPHTHHDACNMGADAQSTDSHGGTLAGGGLSVLHLPKTVDRSGFGAGDCLQEIELTVPREARGRTRREETHGDVLRDVSCRSRDHDGRNRRMRDGKDSEAT